MTTDDAGQMLWDENVRSVRERYDRPEGDDLPGPIGCTYQYGTHRRSPEIPRSDMVTPEDFGQLVMSIRCYEDQSCETPDWEKSEAFAFCKTLRNAMLDSFPHDDAVWGAPS